MSSSIRIIFLALAMTLFFLVACSGEFEPTPANPGITASAEATTFLENAPANTPQATDLAITERETEAPASPTALAELTPTVAAIEQTTLFNSPEYGVQTFMWWLPDIAERDLALVQEMEFGWVKQSFAWRDIETLEKGKYDWYRPDLIVDLVENAGLKMLVRIDRQPFWSQENDWPPLENAPPSNYQDFANFCGVMAERYRGRVQAYQIWNEPNLNREWGEAPPNPEEYTELLKVCFQAIKAADPEAIVVSAGLAPTGTGLPIAMPDSDFLQGMYDAGAADYFDVLGLNAPGYKAPPETSPEEADATPEYGGGRWFSFRHVEDMRDIMVANGDAAKQIAILELGWTTDKLNPEYAWHAVTEEEQADYLVRAYQYAVEHWQPWVGPMFTIYLADFFWTPEANEQWWWAITLPDGSPRPAYEALKAMEKITSGPSSPDDQ